MLTFLLDVLLTMLLTAAWVGIGTLIFMAVVGSSRSGKIESKVIKMEKQFEEARQMNVL